jgi:transcriptional regulator with XRE-family HTH domain
MKNGQLRAARALKGLNQFDTARRARISFNRYCRIELGQAVPTDKERQRIARVVGADAETLFAEAVSA